MFAHEIGLPVAHISIFMSSVIVGGMALQLPIGRLSDRFDRRKIIVAACLSNALLGMAIYLWADRSKVLLFVLAFVFGGFALTLYSLCVAHTNDFLAEDNLVEASSALLLAFGVGALFGPLVASLLMVAIGPQALFLHIAIASAALVSRIRNSWQRISGSKGHYLLDSSVIQLPKFVTFDVTNFGTITLGSFAIYRLGRRAPVPKEEQERFVGVPETTHVVHHLDPRVSRGEG